MSYIRNTSNPEGLYIWSGEYKRESRVGIKWGGLNGTTVSVTQSDFDIVMNTMLSEDWEENAIVTDSMELYPPHTKGDREGKYTLVVGGMSLKIFVVTLEAVLREHQRQVNWSPS